MKGLLRIAFMLFGSSLVAFALVSFRVSAGAPGETGSPLHLRYLQFLQKLVAGDLGHSLAFGKPLGDALRSGLATTLALALGAGILCALLAVFLGRVAAASDGGMLDRLVRFYMALGRSTSAFWLAVVLIMLLGLATAPPTYAFTLSFSSASLAGLILPVISLAFVMAPGAIGQLRAGLLQERFADHVAAARARGLPEGLIHRRHVFRNSLIPSVGRIAGSLGPLLGATVAVEKAFGLPGLGRLLVDSVLARDYFAAGLSAWVFAVALIFLRLPADVIGRVLDPRAADVGAEARSGA